MEAPNWFETIQLQVGAALADLRYNWKPKLKRVRLHLLAFGLFALGLLEAVDPYALQQLLPERWAAVVPFAFGGILWMLRKAVSHPPVVTTTYYGEQAVTEPHVAPRPDEADVHRMDDDGAPHAPAALD